MNTVKDAALTLRETQRITDVLRRFAPRVQLHKNGAELCGACPKCGDGGKGEASDRFYITGDGRRCACRKCHEQRMDAAGLVAWLLDVPMHEAVDMLRGYSPARTVVSVSRGNETETGEFHETRRETEQTCEWREVAAQYVAEAQKRLLDVERTTADVARDYLRRRGLTQETWQAFTLGYARKNVPVEGGTWEPAVCWPVTHEESGETVAVRYRFTQVQEVNGKSIRFTSRKGGRTSGRMFGAALLPKSGHAERCLVVTEGEFNAMSVWQACHVAGVDVLSFGSESQRSLPAWCVELASSYGAVVTWVDRDAVALDVGRQLPNAVKLRSRQGETGVKLDANELLVAGTLGGLVQTARLSILRESAQHGVLRQLTQAWDAVALDVAQQSVAMKLAMKLGVKLADTQPTSPAAGVEDTRCEEAGRPWLPAELCRTFATFGEARTYQLAQAHAYRSRLGRDGEQYFVRG